MPYVRCPEKQEYAAGLSTIVGFLEDVRGLTNQVSDYTVLTGSTMRCLLSRTWVIVAAIDTPDFECGQLLVPCLKAVTMLRCLRSARLVADSRYVSICNCWFGHAFSSKLNSLSPRN